MRKFLTAALAGLTLAAGFGAAQTAQAQPGYYYGGSGWNNGRWDNRWNNGRWDDRRYYGRRDDGALAALAAGALIGSVVAQGARGAYYDRGYYDGGYYYDRPYRVRCFNQRVWDPYWGRTVIRGVCR